jgi:transcriptional regulator NrdR family protein
MLDVHKTEKNMEKTGIGYLVMRKLKKKMLKTYHRILKASVKRKFDKADDLNWKLLQLEIKLKQLDDADDRS